MPAKLTSVPRQPKPFALFLPPAPCSSCVFPASAISESNCLCVTVSVRDRKTAIAYNDAASRDACPIAKIGELGGMTLTPGLYKSTSGMAVSTDLILDAKGYEEAVWIFQMASTFVSAVSAKIVLQNGANARNIFWQVGSSGTIGAYSTFEGTMMAHASITLGAGAVVNGRIFAQTGAVTMLANIITLPHPHACHDHHHHHSCDQRPVALGEAEHFSVLAGAQVTNIGTSAIFGDLGVSPGTAVTGVGPDVMLQDSSIAAQLVSDAGKIDLGTAPTQALCIIPTSSALLFLCLPGIGYLRV
mmetsp:Transcript_26323/g.40546  ORF Transcript_26323/g.40546 Transcript_26323/m.40546 type:complete len:301 (+) Transcript_26323:3-905(+)